METTIARQPIFNLHKNLYAYELLYRGLEELSLALVGGDRATSVVLTSSFLTEGLEKISNNRPCFVNFTEELLMQDVAANFPSDKIIVEILEDVQPTPAVIEACRRLKKLGYTLALDDFVELAASRITLLSLVAEVNRPEIERKRLTELISSDVSLSYKLLRFINSAFFSRRSKIDSISYAIAFIGENEAKRFITMLAISKMASNKPAELVRLAVIRAKFCEGLARMSLTRPNPDELFMVGLFSLLSAMLDAPVDEIFGKVPISGDAVLALTRLEGPFARFLQTVIAHENRAGDICLGFLNDIEVPREKVAEIYLQAVYYADTLTSL